MEGIARDWNNNSLKDCLSKLNLMFVIYSIWNERKNQAFNRKSFPKELIVVKVNKDMLDKVL